MGRATKVRPLVFDALGISIHALRGEGDAKIRLLWYLLIISIHALRGEGDGVPGYSKANNQYFNPRPPWGGRQQFH